MIADIRLRCDQTPKPAQQSSAGDALAIINRLAHQKHDGRGAPEGEAVDASLASMFYDVNDDGQASASDALRVINELGSEGQASGAVEWLEGELGARATIELKFAGSGRAELEVRLSDAPAGQTFELLVGGPLERRQFLDWLVFHVKHEFLPAWRQARQALKQRNSLLRSGRINSDLLSPWDIELARNAEALHLLRSEVFLQFSKDLAHLLKDIPALSAIDVSYFGGWEEGVPLAELLKLNLQRDAQLGHTSVGPHRADLRLRLAKMPASDVLSRGQQKLFVCALRICAGRVFKRLTGRDCIYLIDDLPSELDEEHRLRLATWLMELESQVFITGVSRVDLESVWDLLAAPRKVFHVEQGSVTATI